MAMERHHLVERADGCPAAIVVDPALGDIVLDASTVVIGIVLVLGPHVYLANQRPR
jgi:hypothetical protein